MSALTAQFRRLGRALARPNTSVHAAQLLGLARTLDPTYKLADELIA
jgi:hypothetical protein